MASCKDVVKYLVISGCYGISDIQSLASTESSASTEPWFCDACKAGVVPVSMSPAWLSAFWLLSACLPVCLSVCLLALLSLSPAWLCAVWFLSLPVCLSVWQSVFQLCSVSLSPTWLCAVWLLSLPACLSSSSAWSVCLPLGSVQSGSCHCLSVCLSVCLPALLSQSVSCLALCSLAPVTACLPVCQSVF